MGINVIVTKLNYDSFHPLFLAMLKILFSVLALLFYIYYKKISFEKVSIKKLIVQTNLLMLLFFVDILWYAICRRDDDSND